MNLLFALLLDLLLVVPDQGAGPQAPPGPSQMDMFFTVSVDKYSFPSGHTTRARPCVALHPEPPGAGHSTEGAGGALGLHLGSLQGHAGAAPNVTDGTGFFLGYMQYSIVDYCWLSRTLLQSSFYCGTNGDTISFSVAPGHLKVSTRDDADINQPSCCPSTGHFRFPFGISSVLSS